jgi:DNA-binding response OmpR family regulator
MGISCHNLGVTALSSGLKLYVDSEDASNIMLAIRGSGLLSVQWERVGAAEQVNQQLIREARCSRPDAWLVDRAIPLVVERVRSIRATEGAVPILALSNGAPHAEALALEAGADAFCRWPEDADLLASRVHALLRRASGTFSISIARSIEVLHASRQLRLGDHVIQLSPPEYLLMARLDKVRNSWVPSQDLWALFSPNNIRPHDSSLLRMHVLRVRRKLGNWRWVLRTERGKGTMLTDQPELGSSIY